MAILTNALSSLIATGNDAQSNLYRVNFSGGVFDSSNSEAFTIRCSSFDPPAASQEVYTVRYVTAYIDRPVTKVTLDKHFNLKFRTDDYWQVYKALCDQQQINLNAQKSYVNIDMSETQLNKMFNVTVDYISKLSTDGNPDDVVRLFNFKYCWIDSITPDTFTTEGNQPLSVDCSINFMQMEDWQSGLTGDYSHSNTMLTEAKVNLRNSV